jgi:hypothetical protein
MMQKIKEIAAKALLLITAVLATSLVIYSMYVKPIIENETINTAIEVIVAVIILTVAYTVFFTLMYFFIKAIDWAIEQL